jgi:TRAP transporter TAXI family solute receptor
MLLIAMMLTCAAQAKADDGEFDPAKVSDSLKAIFQFGSVRTKQALNANTVTLISGTIGGTYVQIGADLASVLDNGNELRVLPIIGRGSVQSVADILFLQGVDLGIVRADTLDYLEKMGFASDIKKQFNYITKLYNEEMHVIAPKTIRSLADLEGKTVSVDLPNGGTFVTALSVFERLGIKPKFVYVEQRIALEKLHKGEIDAVIAVQGKPSKIISQIKDERLHFVPVDYPKSLQGDYLPATLSAQDYPNLLSEHEEVDTIAVPAVLAVYNWAPDTERYRKLALFVDNFFTKFPKFQNPPFHPKWKEVSLSAPLPNWQRFPAAAQWLDAHRVEPVGRRFDEFLQRQPVAANLTSEAEKTELFRQFKLWEQAQDGLGTAKDTAQDQAAKASSPATAGHRTDTPRSLTRRAARLRMQVVLRNHRRGWVEIRSVVRR